MFMELARAAYKVVKLLAGVEAGESVLVLADTAVDRSMVDVVTAMAHAVGGEAVEVVYETRSEVNVEPPKPVAAAMASSDVIIDFVYQYIIHTNAFYEALNAGARICDLTGMNPDMMIRLIGKVDYEAMCKLGDALAKVISMARKIEVHSPKGTSLVMENDPHRPVYHNDGKVRKPGELKFLGGQVSWAPIEKSINGRLVLDGFLWPPQNVGVLSSPVALTIEEGRIVDVEGGWEAEAFKRWLAGFNDPKMYYIAHVSFGFNPGARLTGVPLEDERVYGCIEFGFGSQSLRFKGKVGRAKAHSDGNCLNPTVYVDGTCLLKDGRFVHPELVEFDRKLLG
ncbi:MAG: hypothetical protein NDF55_03220 [archaeon GB-1867-005]|nr:hypothetical protein [Candidatus Culexmicrobium cathedralense]